MHVHLVPVKICIVGWAYCRVEPECPAFHHLDPVSHDAHPVERGLPVEEHYIAVPQLSFDCPAGLDHFRNRVEVVCPEPEPAVIRPDDIVCPAGRVHRRASRTIPCNLLELLDVIGGGPDRDCHLVCDRTGHTDFGYAEIGVGGYHGTGGEVHAFARERTAEPAVLAFEALGECL